MRRDGMDQQAPEWTWDDKLLTVGLAVYVLGYVMGWW